MDMSIAIVELERHASAEDPIFYGGKETTPRDLAETAECRCADADKVKIRFCGYHPARHVKLKWRSGTVADMVRERMATVTAVEGPTWAR